MQVFTHQLTITDLKNQDLNEPYSIVYTADFGIPPSDFTRYVESLGGMANIDIAVNTPFNDKFMILKEYIKNGENIFSSSLNKTIRNLIKLHKGVNEEEIEDSLFVFSDLIKIKALLSKEIEDLNTELDSLFFALLIISKTNANTFSALKRYYPPEFITDSNINGCLIPLIADEETFELFKFGIKQTPYLYTKLFSANENKIFMLLKKSFIYSILTFMKSEHAERFLKSIGGLSNQLETLDPLKN